MNNSNKKSFSVLILVFRDSPLCVGNVSGVRRGLDPGLGVGWLVRGLILHAVLSRCEYGSRS